MTDFVTIKMGTHEYNFKFTLADIRHKIILGTPWHHDVYPTAEHREGIVRI